MVAVDDRTELEERMRTKTLPIASISRAAYNPRVPLVPGMAEYDRIKASIETFGLVEPLVWNERTGNLVGGHQRLTVLEAMGETKVMVSVVDLDDEQERVLNIALNKITGIWDEGALAAMLAPMATDVAALAGFDVKELRRIAHDNAPVVEGLVDPDDVPEPPADPYVKRGDVWLLGDHRLMCGDSTSADDVARLMDGVLADAIWTDPPYGVAVASRVGTAARSSAEARVETAKMRARAGYDEHIGEIENDDLDLDALTAFLGTTLGLAKQHTRAGAAWYVCAPHGPMGLAFASTLTTLEVWKASLVWVKDSLVMGRADYHYRHEPVYYGWTPGAAHHAVTDRTQDTVWEIPRPKQSVDHPTMKPVALVERAIVNSTDPGERVLDPFVGSGTTIIGCEAQGRVGYGLEVSPRYAQVAIERWQAFTGRKATRA